MRFDNSSLREVQRYTKAVDQARMAQNTMAKVGNYTTGFGWRLLREDLVLLAPAQAFAVAVCHRTTTKDRNREVKQQRGLVPIHRGGGARGRRPTISEMPSLADATAVDGPEMNAFRQAITHPLWATHMLRETGADIERELRPQTPDTPIAQLHRAISALERSAPFIHQLRSATPVLIRLPLHRRRSRILKLGRLNSSPQSGRSGTKIQVWGFVKCVGGGVFAVSVTQAVCQAEQRPADGPTLFTIFPLGA